MARLQIDAASWSTLSRLLDEALDQRPADRAAWLESLGPEHEGLKPQLRDLLAAKSPVETADFLGTLPRVGAADLESTALAGTAGDIVGPYRLLRELGSGGMGAVWLAERVDGLIARPVALKLPLRLAAPRADLAGRMAREREILATLDHRNIARLLDAGVTESGQPFMALEYVEGVPIDRYCAGEGGAPLDLPSRLKLFRQAAEATAYAHGKLVLHRDLKPANILVTSGGGVKLLDFGIAKLLDQGKAAETKLTEISGRALTPEYASPEQVLGEPLTVCSDVYSLGVILFELLTGTRPYRLRRESRGALEDAIVQMEPPRASEVAPQTWRKALRGDLDTIVAKALKKNPQERYGTVLAMVDDIQRHLERRPVLARPDSGWYRLRRFVARNRVMVATASVALAAVLIGAGIAVWQAVEADAQRDAALRGQRRSEAYSDFMGVLLQDAGGGQGSKPLSATELLDRGVAMLDRQSGLDDSVTAYMWYELSRNYLLFVNARREIELLDRAAAGAERIGDHELLAASHCSASWSMAMLQADVEGAQRRFDQGRAALARMARPAEYARVDCLRAEARLLESRGQIDRAIELIVAGRRQISPVADRSGWRNDVLMTQLSGLYRAQDRFKDALALSEESLRAVRASGRAGSLAELVSLNNHAGNLCRLGEYLRCGEIGEQTLQWISKAEVTHQPVGLRSNVAATMLRLGQPDRALELAEHDMRLTSEAGSTTPNAIARLNAARALLALGRIAEARERIAPADALWNGDPKAFRRMVQESQLLQAEMSLAGGDLAAARAGVSEILAWAGYPEKQRQPGLDRVLRFAARVAIEAGDPAAALGYATDAYDMAARISRELESSADVGLSALLCAEALGAQGRIDEGRQRLRLALAALGNGLGEDHAETRRAHQLARTWNPQGS
jgi:serine/threonine protein kinase/tetratricopeptide (TPR) repeat protein